MKKKNFFFLLIIGSLLLISLRIQNKSYKNSVTQKAFDLSIVAMIKLF